MNIKKILMAYNLQVENACIKYSKTHVTVYI